uniref:Ribosomal protein eL8/eL30/eS12/Gadd45 domain-containing protein n=1 Tax=Photinus pyralis TaxID=7054 RepID=A0A1Y1N6Z2_PHOPY
MEAHILSAEQQKHSLSGKKKTKKTTVKNVLGTPYANYWPLINSNEEQQICSLLRKDFGCFKADKVSVPWSVMKTIPKEQRKAFRSANITSPTKSYRSSVVFGVNEATRLLEKKLAGSVLISDDVEPKFIVKHVVDICVLHKVPILVVPNLKNLLKEVMNLPSLVVAFKRTKLDYSRVNGVIKEIYRNYPPPKDHIHSNRDFEDNAMDVSESNSDSEDPQLPSLYLQRTSSERVFIPQPSRRRESIDSDLKVKGEEFLSFETERPIQLTPAVSEARKEGKVSYKSLLLKRVASDKNRDIKKIVQLKKKKK